MTQNGSKIVDRIAAAQDYIALAYSPEIIAAHWKQILEKTNLGCGDKILPGYVNVDVAASRRGLKPDVLCDLHKLTSFEDNTVDEILSVHVVEHFWRWEVARLGGG